MKQKENFDLTILDVVVCPVTKQKLVYDKKKNELISKKAKLAYPIKDGIPILLTDEARKINDL
ncbi:MAG: Trm112 family protein [Pseudomonadota bacterium]|nr:Trm112 family protein [Pseudomonadota bacterium]